MSSVAYIAMKTEIEKDTYTEVSAKETIANFYAKQQITSNEYDELIDLANSLDPNSEEGKFKSRIVAIEKSIESIEKDIQAIKDTIDTSGTPVIPPSEDNPTGESYDPITAYRGMTYYKDKYYKDPEDNKTYICFRDSDTEPGTGIILYYLPHELINLYFSEYVL